MRTAWLCRLNDETQVLFGALAGHDPAVIHRALDGFERRCPAPSTTTERLVLRGVLVEAFLRLDTALDDWTSSGERAAARQQLHEASLTAPLPRLIGPARRLIDAARRMRLRPVHERAREWIDEHPDDPRSIRDIARLLGAHPRTLNRYFARYVGMTVQAYRWRRRAERARQLIAGSALKVDSIAGAIGAGSKATVYRLVHRKAADR